MTIKTSLAKFTGKSAQLILEKFFKRGSTLPGKIALKFDPEILSALTKKIAQSISTTISIDENLPLKGGGHHARHH